MMKAAVSELAEIKQIVDYDPETGTFTRLVRTSNRCAAGDRADRLIRSGNMTGYRHVNVLSRRHFAHRLAWLFVYGEWPQGEIDHLNGDPSDNRISNLRDVTKSVNAQNRRGAKSGNGTGFLGVTLHKTGVYRASIQIDGRKVYVGQFGSPEDAHRAYLSAKRKYHEGCTL